MISDEFELGGEVEMEPTSSQAGSFQHHYLLSEARIAEQSKASVCVYKAYDFVLFYDRSFR